jgi:large subunit ribosomal protein L24
MAVKKLHVKKNDMVMIMTGKEKGKTGKIIKVFTDKGRVLVENLNVVKRHSRPTRANAQGGIIEKEAPLASSNVLLFCTACSKPTRTGKRLLEDGSKARFCKKCNEIVDR